METFQNQRTILPSDHDRTERDKPKDELPAKKNDILEPVHAVFVGGQGL